MIYFIFVVRLDKRLVKIVILYFRYLIVYCNFIYEDGLMIIFCIVLLFCNFFLYIKDILIEVFRICEISLFCILFVIFFLFVFLIKIFENKLYVFYFCRL